jgi:hypothetical protein
MQSRRGWFPALLAGFVALAAIVATASADAQGGKKRAVNGGAEIITGSSLDAIVAALEKRGFSVELKTDRDDDPLIESTDQDEPFQVHFYGCTGGSDCQYLQFVSGWDLSNGTTAEVIERWNEDRVWGRAFLDSDDDPWIDLAVNLKGGVTSENFDDTVSWWRSIMRDFEDYIGYTK